MRIWFIFMMIMCVVTAPPVSAADAPLSVYTVNYPLKYFAEQIGGEHVQVRFPAPADVDPAYWTPDVATIGKFQEAEVILLNGAGYAKWIGKVSLPRSKLIDTSKSFRKQYIRTAGSVTHTHGPGDAHAHENLAFTTWLDLSLAAEQARAIVVALSRKRPVQKDTFKKNYQKLERELLALDQHLKTLVSNNTSQPLLASHPVYDYFTRRYKLNIKSVHWEPDLIPNHQQMMELEQVLKDHPARWMIWEDRPLKKSVELLKAIGVDSLVFDPCANVPEQGDFLRVMQQNVAHLKAAFQ